MSKFLLRPAHLRDGKFAPDRESVAIEMDWPRLVQRLSPSRSRESLLILKQARAGMFLGTRRQGSSVLTFAFDTAGRSRRVRQQDPSFSSSVVEVFFVEEAHWPAKLLELGVERL